MVKIRIIAEKSFGYENKDLSIEIPEKGNLEKLVNAEDIPETEPKSTQFAEYLGYTNQRINRHLINSFPAVEMSPFFMIWISERKECVGIKYKYAGCDSELDGVTETIKTDGPFRLNENCAELIRKAYRSRAPIEKVLHTSPDELRSY